MKLPGDDMHQNCIEIPLHGKFQDVTFSRVCVASTVQMIRTVTVFMEHSRVLITYLLCSESQYARHTPFSGVSQWRVFVESLFLARESVFLVD